MADAKELMAEWFRGITTFEPVRGREGEAPAEPKLASAKHRLGRSLALPE
jgi:hypothetical protein